MNKKTIEWVRNPDGTQGYTWNPITGCLNHIDGMCEGGNFPCYAYRLANGRLSSRYLANENVGSEVGFADIVSKSQDPFYPRFWEDRLWQFHKGDYDKAYPGRTAYFASIEKEKGIFVCDMSDLFGIGIPEEWTRKVMSRIKDLSQHRFYLLTKQPQNLAKFSPFPDNCYVGITVTGDRYMKDAYEALDCIQAKTKFISIEPFLEPFSEANIKLIAGAAYYRWLDWLIIGAQTNPTVYPELKGVQEIVEAADKAGIPVFLKDNLKSLLADFVHNRYVNLYHRIDKEKEKYFLRQEMPK